MGCCGSKAADVDERDNGADAASKELDRQMAEQQKEEAQVTKLLVLGTGESGKSTIFKQMKILYAVPDPPAKYIPVCRANLIGNAHMVHGAQHVHAEGSWWQRRSPPHLSRPVLAQRRSPRSRAPAPRGPDPGGPGLKGGPRRSSHAWWSAQAHAPALRRGRSLDEAARSHARQAAWRCSVSSSLRPLARRPPKRSRGSRLMATRSARCVRMCKQPSPAACAQACRLRPGLLRVPIPVPLQGARDMALGAQRMAQRDAQHMGLHTWDTGSGRSRARRYALAMWHGACAAHAPRA